MKPTILIATTDRWFPTARLAMALAKVGCTVDAVCPTVHPMQKTSAVRRMHIYHGLAPLRSFAAAIAVSGPDVIVPGDDLATWHLHQLWDQANARGSAGSTVCELITRSLGSPDSFSVIQSRARFMRSARDAGVRVPETEVIDNTSNLRAWSARPGFPMVLKANGTSGGDGVQVVRTFAEAERAFRKLQAPPLIARALKRAIVDQDSTLVRASLSRRRHIVSAQTFVAGHEANSTVACWNGEVLASLHFEVLQKRHASGPATVLRWIDHPEMAAATKTMVRKLRLSGFHGFDFMLEEATGSAYLIEINPRTTQVGHLALGPNRNLPLALYSALSGQNAPAESDVVENDTIALFPHEWMRDPESPYLKSAYHDIPWDEPELVAACLQKVRQQCQQHLACKRRADLGPEFVANRKNASASQSSTPVWIAGQSKSRYE